MIPPGYLIALGVLLAVVFVAVFAVALCVTARRGDEQEIVPPEDFDAIDWRWPS